VAPGAQLRLGAQLPRGFAANCHVFGGEWGDDSDMEHTHVIVPRRPASPGEVRSRRKALGLPREALAVAASVSTDTLGRYERARSVRRATAAAITAALEAFEAEAAARRRGAP